MNYASGAAFRRALEQRLSAVSLREGTPLVRLRKMAAFDRFLARLFQLQPDAWVLKGGLAMQLRLGGRARTTKDIDLLSFSRSEDILTTLREAAALNLGDWFTFEVTQPSQDSLPDGGGLRYPILALLDGRTFEQFHMDIGIGDAVVGVIEYLYTSDLLAFAGLTPTRIPCYPVTQQIAEKLHAYTKPRRSGESSRVKDFIDILLLMELETISGVQLSDAIQATFDTEGTHPVPDRLPTPPRKWQSEFSRMVYDVGISPLSLDQGYSLLQKFMDPILAGESLTEWNPTEQSWK